MALGSDRRALTAAFAGILVAGTLAAAAGPPAAAAPSTTRYASPNGSGTSCTQTAPCDIVEAVGQAPDGAVVIVKPGHYGSEIAPLAHTIANTYSTHIAIQGQSGKAPPVIYTSTANGVYLTDSSIENLRIVHQGSTAGIRLTNSLANRVQVETTAPVGCEISESSLTNSTCFARNGTGVHAGANLEANAATLRNVTAIGGNPVNGVGVSCEAQNGGTCQLQIVNCIAHGDHIDAKVSAPDNGSTAKMSVFNTSLGAAESTVGAGATAEINRYSGDITEPADFVNPAKADFREAADSPTIDAGLDDGVYGKKDVAGRPRFMGDAVDIGAFEFPVPAHLSHVHVVRAGKHSVRVRATVDTEGLAAAAQLLAKHKGSTISAKPTPLGARTGTRSVSLTVKQLKRHTRYRITVAVTDNGGTTSEHVRAKTH